jgi:hypothetical protein
MVDLTFELMSKGKKTVIPLRKSVTEWYTDKGEFVASNFLKDYTSIMTDFAKKTK